MPKLILVAPEQAPGSLLRLQDALAEECGALGITAETIVGETPKPGSNAVAIALCTPDAVPHVDLESGLPTVVVLACDWDNFGSDVNTQGRSSAPLATLLESASAVFATEPAGIRLFERLEVRAHRLCCGYTRGWDFRPRFEERDIDVVVYVPRSSSAFAVVSELVAELEHLDIRVLLSDEALTEAGHPEDAVETRRGRFLSRARSFVALKDGEGAGVSWMPCIEAMLAGAAVLVEDPSALEPLRQGRDFLTASPDAMPHTLIALLADSPFRFGMANRAYTTLRLEIPLRGAVAEIYEAARLAALV